MNVTDAKSIVLRFDAGTLLLDGVEQDTVIVLVLAGLHIRRMEISYIGD